MARVFITGSSDGLGQMAAQLLVEQGHNVVLHARSEQRGQQALAAVPGAESVVIGDLASIAQTRNVAEQVNRLGSLDAVIHNAAVGYQEPRSIATEDGLPHVFAINTLAPYILTALIRQPKRLVYLSSGLHQSGDASLKDLVWEKRPWRGQQAIPTANCTMCCWPSPSHDAGPEFYRTPLSPAGCPPRWVAEEHRTIWTRATEPRSGLPPAMTRTRPLPGNIFSICGRANRIQPPATP